MSRKSNNPRKNMPPHGNRKYPWAKWQDGKARWVNAADYGVSAKTLAKVVTNRSLRIGREIDARVDVDRVWIQFGSKRKKTVVAA